MHLGQAVVAERVGSYTSHRPEILAVPLIPDYSVLFMTPFPGL